MTLGHFDPNRLSDNHLVESRSIDWNKLLDQEYGGRIDLLRIKEGTFLLIKLEGGEFLHINRNGMDEAELQLVADLIRRTACDVFHSGLNYGKLQSAEEYLSEWEY
jgi:hypothetical protein